MDETETARPAGRRILVAAVVGLLGLGGTLIWAMATLDGWPASGLQRATDAAASVLTVAEPRLPPALPVGAAAPSPAEPAPAAAGPGLPTEPTEPAQPTGPVGPAGIVTLTSPEPAARGGAPAPVVVIQTMPDVRPTATTPVATPVVPAPVDTAREPSGGEDLAAAARVFIHYTGQSEARRVAAERLAGRLTGAGFEVVAIRPVRGRIDRGSVRYFRAPDGEAGRGLLRVVDGALPGTVWQLVDFTAYPLPPRPGTLEVWLPSGLPATAG